MKKVISFLLSLVMIVSLAVVPSNESRAEDTMVENTSSFTVSNPHSSMTVLTEDGETVTDETSDYVSTDPEKVLKTSFRLSYNQDDILERYRWGRAIPIEVSSAGELVITTTAVDIYDDISAGLYKDADRNVKIDYLDSLFLSDSSVSSVADVPNSGKYYIILDNTIYSDVYDFTNVIDISIAFYPSSNLTLKSGETYSLGRLNSGNDVYYKVSMPSAGYLNIYSNTEISFSLLDSSKSAKYTYQRIDKDYGSRCTYKLSKGTYYIKPTSAYTNSGYYTLKYTTMSEYSTMKEGSYSTIYPGNSKQTTYLKFKPTKTGYVTVYTYDTNVFDDNGYVTLCNSSKKALSASKYIYPTNKQVYGVKKGTTYYLKLTDFSGKAKIAYKNTSISEKSGSTKKKAVTVSKNKYKTGSITAGSSTVDWYKVKLTKKQYLKMIFKGSANGTLKVKIYNSKGKLLSTNTAVYGRGSNYSLKTWSKYSKGTYYIKVYRYNSQSSGYYKFKWY